MGNVKTNMQYSKYNLNRQLKGRNWECRLSGKKHNENIFAFEETFKFQYYGKVESKNIKRRVCYKKLTMKNHEQLYSLTAK